VALRHCGIVALWHCGTAALWHCGIVALRHCGTGALWHCGIVGHHCGASALAVHRARRVGLRFAYAVLAHPTPVRARPL